jgi:hypothetical protein
MLSKKAQTQEKWGKTKLLIRQGKLPYVIIIPCFFAKPLPPVFRGVHL